MKPIGPISAYAPLPTGHPLGLPDHLAQGRMTKRVEAPSKSGASDLEMRRQSLSKDTTGKQAKTAPSDARDVPAKPSGGQRQGQEKDPEAGAPPTILQLKINEMLQAQKSKEDGAPQPSDTDGQAKSPQVSEPHRSQALTRPQTDRPASQDTSSEPTEPPEIAPTASEPNPYDPGARQAQRQIAAHEAAGPEPESPI